MGLFRNFPFSGGGGDLNSHGCRNVFAQPLTLEAFELVHGMEELEKGFGNRVEKWGDGGHGVPRPTCSICAAKADVCGSNIRAF